MDRLLRLNELTINNIHLPLLGDTALPTEKNHCIFSNVQAYIQETRRFSLVQFSITVVLYYIYILR